ncbi:hypothetical protein DFH06DRAFT_1127496 [Mycena polygramma]|nr:hypothetical protein DFH06DRAFT_1127490 [Mycena polygramma]KAJ7665135.1 hypothetical protein DFH06DRAFT_1127496 [Mycena polygramma]
MTDSDPTLPRRELALIPVSSLPPRHLALALLLPLDLMPTTEGVMLRFFERATTSLSADRRFVSKRARASDGPSDTSQAKKARKVFPKGRQWNKIFLDLTVSRVHEGLHQYLTSASGRLVCPRVPQGQCKKVPVSNCWDSFLSVDLARYPNDTQNPCGSLHKQGRMENVTGEVELATSIRPANLGHLFLQWAVYSAFLQGCVTDSQSWAGHRATELDKGFYESLPILGDYLEADKPDDENKFDWWGKELATTDRPEDLDVTRCRGMNAECVGNGCRMNARGVDLVGDCLKIRPTCRRKNQLGLSGQKCNGLLKARDGGDTLRPRNGRWEQKVATAMCIGIGGTLVRALDASTSGKGMRGRRSLSRARRAETPSLGEHGPAQDSADTGPTQSPRAVTHWSLGGRICHLSPKNRWLRRVLPAAKHKKTKMGCKNT